MKKLVSMCLALILLLGMTTALADDAKTTLNVTLIQQAVAISPTEMQFLTDLCEEANVEVKWKTYTSQTWQEVKNVILATPDELPDIFIGAITKSDFATYNYYFIPLEGLIEKCGPHITAMFEAYPDTKTFATELDGSIYGLPTRWAFRPATHRKWYINQVWLNNLGLEIPTTFDELYDVLKAFKEQDANGNGNPNDEIPFIIPNSFNFFMTHMTRMMGAYGNYSDIQTTSCKDGQFVCLPATEDFRDTIAFVHKLYADGLLYEESLTLDYSTWSSLARDPESENCGCTIAWSANEFAGSMYDSQFVCMDQIAATKDIQPVSSNTPYNSLTYKGHGAQITTVCKNPEAAMRFLDLWYKEIYSVQAYFGSIGTALEQNADGTYTFIVPEGYGVEEWQRINAVIDTGLYYISDELQSRLIVPKAFTQVVDDEAVISKRVAEADGNAFYFVKLDPEDNAEAAVILNDLQTITSTYMADWVVNGIAEGSWEEYVKNLEKAQMKDYLAIYQNAYDEQMK